MTAHGDKQNGSGASVKVRVATLADIPLILQFIKDLAEYERLGHAVEATEADIRRDLFGENPRCFCDIAEAEGKPVGFALWFYNYSTFRGRAGIYLEDLFVKPEARAWAPARRCCVGSPSAASTPTSAGWSGRC